MLEAIKAEVPILQSKQCVMSGRCLGFLKVHKKMISCYKCKKLVHSCNHCSVNKDPYNTFNDFYICRHCDEHDKQEEKKKKNKKEQNKSDLHFVMQQRKRGRNEDIQCKRNKFQRTSRRGVRCSRRIRDSLIYMKQSQSNPKEYLASV